MTPQVKLILDSCDWNAYEENILAAMQQAIEKYNQLCSKAPGEKVYQVSIWTDPQTQESAINFETKSHAEDHTKKWAGIFRDKYNDEPTALRLEAEGFNGNPADFKHTVFFTQHHPEIAALDKLNFQYTTHSHAAEARISASLRKAVKQIKHSKMLNQLLREEVIYIGTNSPRDWYDHVSQA